MHTEWLVVGFLASLGALLYAAALTALHIWNRRRRSRAEEPPEQVGHEDESDLESKV
jgi:hypothetical protein